MTRALARALALLVIVTVACTAHLALASTSSATVWRVTAPDATVDPLAELAEYENRIAFLVNKKRKAHDLRPVRYFDSCVDRTAERWSAHLMEIGKLVHRDLTKVLRNCDLNWVGETLVSGTSLPPRTAVKAWMASPPHREVLMRKRARLVGVGTRVDPDGRFITVLNFGDRS